MPPITIRFKNIFRSFLLVLGLSILLTAVVIPLERRVSAYIQELKQKTISYLEETLNRKISIGRFSPGVFAYFKISDLRIYDSSANDTANITIKKVRLYYDIAAVISGNFESSIRELRLEDTDLVFDAEKDQKLINFLSALINDLFFSSPEIILPEGLVVSGRNITFAYDSPEFSFSAGKSFFEVREQSGNLGLNLKSNLLINEEYSSFVRTSGIMNVEKFDYAGKLYVKSFNAPEISLKPLVFSMEYSGNNFSLTKIQDKLPIDIRMFADLSEQLVQLSFKSEDFLPTDIIQSVSEDHIVYSWKDSNISGGGIIELFQGNINYDLELFTSFKNQDFPFARNGTVAISGNLENAQIDNIVVNTDYGIFEYSGEYNFTNTLPNGILIIRNGYHPDVGSFSGTFLIKSDLEAFTIQSTKAQLNGLYLRFMEISLLGKPDDTFLPFYGILGLETGAPPVLRVSGVLDRTGASPQARATISLDKLPIHKIARGINIPDFDYTVFEKYPAFATAMIQAEIGQNSVKIGTSGNFNIDFPSYALKASSMLSFENNVLLLDNYQLQINSEIVNGSSEIDFTDNENIKFLGDLQWKDLDFVFSGSFEENRLFTMKGSYDTSIKFLTVKDSPTLLQLKTLDLPIQFENQTMLITTSAQGEFESFENWNFFINRFNLFSSDILDNRDFSISLSGQATPTAIELFTLHVNDGISDLEGSGTASWYFSEQRISKGVIDLQSTVSNEAYSLNFSGRPEKINIIADVTESPIERFIDQGLRGNLNGEIAFSGTVETPNLTANLNTTNAFFNDDPINLSVLTSLDPQRIFIENLEIQYMGHTIRDVSGSFNLSEGIVEARANYVGTIGITEQNLEIEASSTFSEPLDIADLQSFEQQDYTGSITIKGIKRINAENEIWRLDFQRKNNSLSLAGGPQNAISLHTSDDGSFTASVSAPLPTVFHLTGKMENAQINATMTDISLSLDTLKDYLNFSTIHFIGGDATGALSLSGPVNDPAINGSLVVKNARATLVYITSTLMANEILLSFEGKNMRIVEFPAYAEKSRALVSGVYYLDHWNASGWDLKVTANEDPGVNITYNFGRLDLDGFAKGELDLSGWVGGIDVKGNLEAQDCSITMIPLSDSSPFTFNPDVSLTVDIEIVSGKGIEFLWPNRTIPVIRGFADTGEKVRYSLNSDRMEYSLTGEVEVRGGEIVYFDRSFYLKEGNIIFQENQTDFNPRFSVRAELRETLEGETIKIYLVSENQRFRDFSPQFESDPPMADMEILAMLGQNFYSQIGGESIDLSSAVLLTGDIVSQFGIMRGFEDAMRNNLQVDLFSIRTHVFQNLLEGAITTQDVETTTSASSTAPSLGNYLDNTTLFLGKYLGSDLFLELLIQLKAQDPFDEGSQSFAGVDIESEIGLEWKTPFFLLEWSIAPKHPENLFVTDNSFAFSWRFSY